jgi:patatin-like phospholipase/acyl hydrolase
MSLTKLETSPIKVPDSVSPYTILSLDGGGAKGFYTLGILDELEKNMGTPIHKSFDLIFGTSTGAIIAALLARGDTVEKILKLYREHVPTIMKPTRPGSKTKALQKLANTIFIETQVSGFKTAIGIVATNWKEERPLIFKASVDQAHGSIGSFVPFFGCTVADAVIASCSAYPFFNPHTITKSNGDVLELGDGGFCANNPTLYAIADASKALEIEHNRLRVLSLGVGSYPEPSLWKKAGRIWGGWSHIRHGFNSDFLQKILGTNTCSMEVLRGVLFGDVKTLRINDTFAEPAMATDLLEYDITKLNRLIQKGRLSYGSYEQELKMLLTF